MAFGAGSASTSGTSASRVAQWASPPRKRRVFLPVALTVFVLLLAIMGHSPVMWLVALAPGFWAYSHIRYNLKELPHLRENWLQKWMCLTCGHAFIP